MRRGYSHGDERTGLPANESSSGPRIPFPMSQKPPLWTTAAAPRPPVPVRALERAREAHRRYRSEREGMERRSIARGLIWLAAAALLVSIARAGLDRVFVHGWWNQW
jgi:hypothetical protein